MFPVIRAWVGPNTVVYRLGGRVFVGFNARGAACLN